MNVIRWNGNLRFHREPSGGTLSLTTPGSSLFLGGRPDDFQPRADSGASDEKYAGCLADITVNGKRVDFTDANVRDSSLSQKCLTSEDKMADLVDTDRNGRTIPKVDDSDEDGEAEVLPERTTPSTTTTTSAALPQIEDDYDNTDNEIDDLEEKEELAPSPTPKKPKKEPEVAPTPFMQCALPFRNAPDMDEPVSLDDGVQFGNLDKTSRIEFYQQSDDGLRSQYAIDFKSSYPDGLIFMWTDFDKSDFVALFMRRGSLHFAFDSGSGPAFLNSTKTYNDSEWHTASFTRYKTVGELTVDGALVATGNSSGSTTNVNAGTTVFIGGIPTEAWAKRMTLKKVQNVDSPFRGCLRNFVMRNKSPGDPLVTHSVQPCSSEVENGFYFYPNSGYLKLGMIIRIV